MNQNVLALKKETVGEIQDGIKANKATVIVGYQGFTVKEMSELRRSLKEKDATISVYKNTLVARAFKAEGVEGLDHLLEGPNAIVYGKTETDALGVLRKFSRLHENLKIRGGLIDGTPVDEKTLMELSRLPDKNGMISMLLSCLNAPIVKFAATIKALAESKGSAA